LICAIIFLSDLTRFVFLNDYSIQKRHVVARIAEIPFWFFSIMKLKHLEWNMQ